MLINFGSVIRTMTLRGRVHLLLFVCGTLALIYFGIVHVVMYYPKPAIYICSSSIFIIIATHLSVRLYRRQRDGKIVEHIAMLLYEFFDFYKDTPVKIESYLSSQLYKEQSTLNYYGTVATIKTRLLMKYQDNDDIDKKSEMLRTWLIANAKAYCRKNKLKSKNDYPYLYPLKVEVIEHGVYVHTIVVNCMASINYIKQEATRAGERINVDTTNRGF